MANPTNPYLSRAAQMFPTLSDAQLARVAAIGHLRDVRAGESLFEAGGQNPCFFVVKAGAIEIYRPVGDGEERVTVHQPGGFTGEINMLSARRNLVSARVIADGRSSSSIRRTSVSWSSGTRS
jgi:thioredoxin reductase (NADPH)